ncbi:uncharacterized protein LOC115963003 isoform X2 [Quercus lobata]|uniref:uncharacterized protein LOC115963003 isoform X2 n=1 Tax=Quercus lobata TaxID=97700 RepID=UPI001246E123|nr:uncharacterized protein LOC115963003 isoform X2 [Quercus lobata]
MMERADSSKKLYSRLHLWAFTQLRFFSISVVLFFILWLSSSAGYSLSKLKGLVASSSTSKEEQKVDANSTYSVEWDNHGWFYILVRVAFFLWVALLNLITISSTWARVIDVMDSESGSRLFGFIGAGATVGQLFGSLFATGMASLGPFLLLFAALLMEFAAQSSKGINKDVSHNSHLPEELTPIRALADQLEGTKEEEHKKYRGMVVEYIMVNNNMTVDGIDFYVTDSFGEGFYDSCKDVKFGTMNSRAIQFIGIGAGAQNFKVAVGDVIYIEANSGAVKRVGRSDAFATEFDLQAEEYVPLPKGEVHKKEEIVQPTQG